jgi:hypothetical protein
LNPQWAGSPALTLDQADWQIHRQLPTRFVMFFAAAPGPI